MLANRHLPEKLIMLLSNPCIRKAGRMVASDLKHLEENLDNVPPFCGALDLAVFARERHVISNAKVGLAELCATVLGKQLAKNVSERMSTAWEERMLTSEQIRYAACDAYTPLMIYERLSKLAVPAMLPSEPVAGTSVLLYGTDKKIIACGILSSNLHQQSFDGITLSRTRVLLEISEVRIPGAKVSTHHNRELSSFGATPFALVCLRSHVRVYDPVSTTLLNPIHTLLPNNQMDIDTSENLPPDSLDVQENLGEESDGVGDMVHSIDTSETDPISVRSLPELQSHHIDPESEAQGREVFASMDLSDWDGIIRSRVLKDVFHFFNMLRISTSHGLRKEFARALRDIIFIPDKEDRARIAAYAAALQPPTSFEDLRASKPKWLWQHCKRVIPPPKLLYPLVEKIFLTYGPLKDAMTGQPLFTRQNWQTTKQMLELVRQGFISDPPGIPLYVQIGVDSKAGNLPMY